MLATSYIDNQFGFGELAAGVFGCAKAWSMKTEAERKKCSANAIADFHHHNKKAWDEWFPNYAERVQRRMSKL